MKNKEFYNDKLVSIAISGNNVAKVDNRLTTCESTACEDCDWYHDAELVCSEMRSIWADKEYTEDVFGIEPYDLFYFVDCDGRVQSDVYSGKSKYDSQSVEFGNACKDEAYMKKSKLYNLLSNFAHQVNEGWEPDWNDANEGKWFAWFNFVTQWQPAFINSMRFPNMVYFKSRELTRRAIDEVIVPFERGAL